MIEHEARTGAVAHEAYDLGQLVVRRAHIEDQPPPAHLPHALYERALPAESGGLPLDILADAFHPGRAGQRIQRSPESRAPSPEALRQIDKRDDARDPRLRLRQPFHQLYLPLCLVRPAVGFHEHHTADRDLSRGRRIVPREKRPLERRHAFEPRVVQLGGVPEVDVGIHNRTRNAEGGTRSRRADLRTGCSAFRVSRSAFRTYRTHDAAHPALTRSSATASTMIAPMMISWM